jgi:hypothetical protein
LTRAPTETRERFSLSAIYDGLLEKPALPASGSCGGPRDQEAGYSFPQRRVPKHHLSIAPEKSCRVSLTGTDLSCFLD